MHRLSDVQSDAQPVNLAAEPRALLLAEVADRIVARAREGTTRVGIDGIFLHRPELRRHWDFSFFLAVPFNVSIPRMARRDQSSPDSNAPEHRRHVEGQRLYLGLCDPQSLADLVIAHADFAHPVILSARPATTSA